MLITGGNVGGSGVTFTLAIAGFPKPASTEVTPVMLVSSPMLAPLAITFTITVHELPFGPGTPPPASSVPDRLTMFEPASAPSAPVANEAQVPPNPVGVANTSPLGSVSVKLTVSAGAGRGGAGETFGFVIVS